MPVCLRYDGHSMGRNGFRQIIYIINRFDCSYKHLFLNTTTFSHGSPLTGIFSWLSFPHPLKWSCLQKTWASANSNWPSALAPLSATVLKQEFPRPTSLPLYGLDYQFVHSCYAPPKPPHSQFSPQYQTHYKTGNNHSISTLTSPFPQIHFPPDPFL